MLKESLAFFPGLQSQSAFFYFKSSLACFVALPCLQSVVITLVWVLRRTTDTFCLPRFLFNKILFYVAVRLFSYRSHMTLKCSKNKKVVHESFTIDLLQHGFYLFYKMKKQKVASNYVYPQIYPIKIRVQVNLSYSSCWLMRLGSILSLGSVTEAFGRGLGLRPAV